MGRGDVKSVTDTELGSFCPLVRPGFFFCPALEPVPELSSLTVGDSKRVAPSGPEVLNWG